MSTVIGREALRHAECVFTALGHALTELQVYTDGHPRFRDAIKKLSVVLETFFMEHESFADLTFTLTDEQAEFQGIPLVAIGRNGERLLSALRVLRYEGLQILPAITVRELIELLKDLLKRSRHPTRSGAAAGREESPHVRLMTRVVSSSAPGQITVDRKLGQGIMLPSLMVSESTSLSVLSSYRDLLDKLVGGDSLDFDTLLEATDDVVTKFAGQRKIAMPRSFQSYFDDFNFHHSVNVCLLATSVASTFTDDLEVLRRIAVATLVHDIGKSQVPADILHKDGPLTEGERERLMTHTRKGAEMLMAIRGIDPLCVGVAYSHHMNTWAGAYPRPWKDFPSNWVVDLVSVVDVYETLTAARPYKQPVSAKTVFDTMFAMQGLDARQPFVRTLYERLGPYPTGSIVELDSGSRALVVEQHDDPGAPPKVRVLTDPDRKTIPEPLEIDLAAQANGDERDRVKIASTVLVGGTGQDPLFAESLAERNDVLGAPLTDILSLMSREG